MIVIQSIDYAAIAPLLVVAVTGIVVLLADAFGLPRRAVGLLGGAGLLAGLAAVSALAGGPRRATFCLPPGLRTPGPAGRAPGLPSCSYVADDFTLLFQGLILAAALIVVLLSLGEITRSRLPAGEFHFLLLAAITGALTVAAARDLIMLVVALETLSLPVFALVALRRYDGVASEAALKLFLFSVVSTAVTLFGISLVYGVTGAMHLDRIAAALARTPADLEPVAAVGVVLVLAGFAFKIAAVPFHFWAPDVYQGAPLPVAAFLSVVSKAGGFAGLTIVLVVGFPAYARTWGLVIGVLAAATMSLGNLVALRQRHAVRLLAWSSIAQAGYVLAALTLGGPGVQAALVYAVFFMILEFIAFAAVVALRPPASDGGDMLAYRGAARRSPWLGAALVLAFAGLAGLPPGLAGLFAKVTVIDVLVDQGWGWLAGVVALNAVIGLAYYVRATTNLYATAPRRGIQIVDPGLLEAATHPRLPVARPVAAALIAATAAAVVLGFAPQLLFNALT